MVGEGILDDADVPVLEERVGGLIEESADPASGEASAGELPTEGRVNSVGAAATKA
jgi:hypothetical protein